MLSAQKTNNAEGGSRNTLSSSSSSTTTSSSLARWKSIWLTICALDDDDGTDSNQRSMLNSTATAKHQLRRDRPLRQLLLPLIRATTHSPSMKHRVSDMVKRLGGQDGGVDRADITFVHAMHRYCNGDSIWNNNTSKQGEDDNSRVGGAALPGHHRCRDTAGLSDGGGESGFLQRALHRLTNSVLDQSTLTCTACLHYVLRAIAYTIQRGASSSSPPHPGSHSEDTTGTSGGGVVLSLDGSLIDYLPVLVLMVPCVVAAMVHDRRTTSLRAVIRWLLPQGLGCALIVATVLSLPSKDTLDDVSDELLAALLTTPTPDPSDQIHHHHRHHHHYNHSRGAINTDTNAVQHRAYVLLLWLGSICDHNNTNTGPSHSHGGNDGNGNGCFASFLRHKVMEHMGLGLHHRPASSASTSSTPPPPHLRRPRPLLIRWLCDYTVLHQLDEAVIIHAFYTSMLHCPPSSNTNTEIDVDGDHDDNNTKSQSWLECIRMFLCYIGDTNNHSHTQPATNSIRLAVTRTDQAQWRWWGTNMLFDSNTSTMAEGPSSSSPSLCAQYFSFSSSPSVSSSYEPTWLGGQFRRSFLDRLRQASTLPSSSTSYSCLAAACAAFIETAHLHNAVNATGTASAVSSVSGVLNGARDDISWGHLEYNVLTSAVERAICQLSRMTTSEGQEYQGTVAMTSLCISALLCVELVCHKSFMPSSSSFSSVSHASQLLSVVLDGETPPGQSALDPSSTSRRDGLYEMDVVETDTNMDVDEVDRSKRRSQHQQRILHLLKSSHTRSFVAIIHHLIRIRLLGGSSGNATGASRTNARNTSSNRIVVPVEATTATTTPLPTPSPLSSPSMGGADDSTLLPPSQQRPPAMELHQDSDDEDSIVDILGGGGGDVEAVMIESRGPQSPGAAATAIAPAQPPSSSPSSVLSPTPQQSLSYRYNNTSHPRQRHHVRELLRRVHATFNIPLNLVPRRSEEEGDEDTTTTATIGRVDDLTEEEGKKKVKNNDDSDGGADSSFYAPIITSTAMSKLVGLIDGVAQHVSVPSLHYVLKLHTQQQHSEDNINPGTAASLLLDRIDSALLIMAAGDHHVHSHYTDEGLPKPLGPLVQTFQDLLNGPGLRNAEGIVRRLTRLVDVMVAAATTTGSAVPLHRHHTQQSRRQQSQRKHQNGPVYSVFASLYRLRMWQSAQSLPQKLQLLRSWMSVAANPARGPSTSATAADARPVQHSSPSSHSRYGGVLDKVVDTVVGIVSDLVPAGDPALSRSDGCAQGGRASSLDDYFISFLPNLTSQLQDASSSSSPPSSSEVSQFIDLVLPFITRSLLNVDGGCDESRYLDDGQGGIDRKVASLSSLLLGVLRLTHTLIHSFSAAASTSVATPTTTTTRVTTAAVATTAASSSTQGIDNNGLGQETDGDAMVVVNDAANPGGDIITAATTASLSLPTVAIDQASADDHSGGDSGEMKSAAAIASHAVSLHVFYHFVGVLSDLLRATSSAPSTTIPTSVNAAGATLDQSGPILGSIINRLILADTHLVALIPQLGFPSHLLADANNKSDDDSTVIDATTSSSRSHREHVIQSLVDSVPALWQCMALVASDPSQLHPSLLQPTPSSSHLDSNKSDLTQFLLSLIRKYPMPEALAVARLVIDRSGGAAEGDDPHGNDPTLEGSSGSIYNRALFTAFPSLWAGYIV